jgi:hypothetical protein
MRHYQTLITSCLVTLLASTIAWIGLTNVSALSDDTFDWLVNNGLTKYTNLQDFRPNDPISRGEAAKFLTQYGRLIELQEVDKSCEFSDIRDYDSSLTSFIIQSCQLELFQWSQGKFMPYNQITQAQALAVVIRSLEGYLDESKTPWYQAYVDVGQEIWLLDGVDLALLDRTPITRSQLATWLHQAYEVSQGPDLSEEAIIYETDVDSEQDCSSYEQYDSARKVCYYECKNEVECSDIQSQIDEELNSWSDSLEDKDRSFAEPNSNQDETQVNAVYRVDSGEKITLTKGKDNTSYRTLWEEVAQLAPDSLSNTYVEEFAVYNDANSDVLAYVSDDDGNGKWNIVINLATHQASDLKEQKATLIHELSHIITLNNSQLKPDVSSCTTYKTDEWCSTPSSYINAFVKKFWTNISNPVFDEKKFVTDYATTNVEEDMAESFAFFVLEANHNNDTVRNQKVNFYNNYPELVQMRASMRTSLSQSIIRAKKIQE